MKRFALFAMLLSLGLFSVGCEKPKVETPVSTPETDTDHPAHEGEDHADGEMPEGEETIVVEESVEEPAPVTEDPAPVVEDAPAADEAAPATEEPAPAE